jgi:hypothetical protein
MSYYRKAERRVLAIDPTWRGFGFAVLDGGTRLVDWGAREARRDKNRRCLVLAAELIARYEPDLVVIEDYAAQGARRCQRVEVLLHQILRLASGQKIRTRRVSRARLRRVFGRAGATTKHQMALAVTDLFPELAARLPPVRKPWMSEDYRMGIFDAVALAVAAFY